jgi:tRNA modification GTPase
MNIQETSTICAIATPAGSGAIAIIRLSGSNSFAIAQSVFRSKSQQTIENQKSHSILFGEIVDGEDIVDEVLLSIFKNPHSYTGEDAVEISCHGSIYIQQKILEILIKKGAKLAQAGEFTQRAFLNGKMDLAQAEGVADLIASESEAMHKISIQQLKGGFSSALNDLRKQMLDFSALIELELDFSEEDVEFADRTGLQKLIDKLNSEIRKLIDSFSYGNVIKNGIPVAIVGRPNAGKSTLLNSLLNEDRAIVSEIAGTTRDTIEELLTIDGFQFRFIDTAGLRTTTDHIEKIGVERALEKIDKSAVYIYLFDVSILSINDLKKDLDSLNREIPRIVVANKMDLADKSVISEFEKYAEELIFISAKDKDTLRALKAVLKKNVNIDVNRNDIVVSNIRHFEALSKANEAIERVNNGLKNNLPTDLLAMDMRDAVHFIGEITGEISNDELLGHIFKNFCIGK